jgi:hypothetical protein
MRKIRERWRRLHAEEVSVAREPTVVFLSLTFDGFVLLLYRQINRIAVETLWLVAASLGGLLTQHQRPENQAPTGLYLLPPM